MSPEPNFCSSESCQLQANVPHFHVQHLIPGLTTEEQFYAAAASEQYIPVPAYNDGVDRWTSGELQEDTIFQSNETDMDWSSPFDHADHAGIDSWGPPDHDHIDPFIDGYIVPPGVLLDNELPDSTYPDTTYPDMFFDPVSAEGMVMAYPTVTQNMVAPPTTSAVDMMPDMTMPDMDTVTYVSPSVEEYPGSIQDTQQEIAACRHRTNLSLANARDVLESIDLNSSTETVVETVDALSRDVDQLLLEVRTSEAERPNSSS